MSVAIEGWRCRAQALTGFHCRTFGTAGATALERRAMVDCRPTAVYSGTGHRGFRHSTSSSRTSSVSDASLDKQKSRRLTDAEIKRDFARATTGCYTGAHWVEYSHDVLAPP